MKLLSSIVMATSLLLAGSNIAYAGHGFGYGSISSYGYIFNSNKGSRPNSISNYSHGFKFGPNKGSGSKFGSNFGSQRGSGSKFGFNYGPSKGSGSKFGTGPNCVSPVPEPTTAAMFALAPAMIGVAARRRRKK